MAISVVALPTPGQLLAQELQASAISPQIAKRHFQLVDGELALDIVLGDRIAAKGRHASHYATREVAALLDRYSHLQAGGWAFRGLDPLNDFNPMGWAVVKPWKPRTSEEGKTIKYEAPLGQETRVFIAGDPEEWRQILRDPSIPIVVTEGAKKTACLASHGIPAIGLSGVWNGVRKLERGGHRLIPDLRAFAKPGRVFIFDFDNDSKLKTQQAVAKALETTAKCLRRFGCHVKQLDRRHYPEKGVDDFIAAHGINLYKQLLEQAQPVHYWKAKRILATSQLDADHETQGRYLPPLPPLRQKTVHWLDAPMGSGKTTRIGRDWVDAWRAAGGVVAVFTPLNSLGQQAAAAWGIPHIHDYRLTDTEQKILRADVVRSGGIVACINSAHRVRQLLPEDRPLLVVLDEAKQCLQDAVEGGTLRDSWADRWADLIALLQDANAVVAAEAGIDQQTIIFLQQLTRKRLFGIRHKGHVDPWHVTLYCAVSANGFFGKLFSQLRAGKRVLFLSSSQKECEVVAAWAELAGIRHHRIDSTTNEGDAYLGFFREPDSWLRQERPQLLILSPSGKTGLSIEGDLRGRDPYFEEVWGYFSCLDVSTARQMLGRYRPPVPRHVWVPAFVNPAAGEGDNHLAELGYLKRETRGWARLCGIEELLEDPLQAAIDQHLVLTRSRTWAEKVLFPEALAEALRGDGHQVEVVEELEGDPSIAALRRQLREEIAWRRSEEAAGIQVKPEWDETWAHETLNRPDTSLKMRLAAEKVLRVARFPTADWGDPKTWYEGVFSRKAVAGGARLFAQIGGLSQVVADDVAKARKLFQKGLVARHRLPQASKQVALAEQFQPYLDQILQRGELWPNGEPEQKLAEIALQWAGEVKRVWGLHVAPTQSVTAIARKILTKFRLRAWRDRKVTVGGQRLWVYKVAATKTWKELALAAGEALGIPGERVEFVPVVTPEDEERLSKPRAKGGTNSVDRDPVLANLSHCPTPTPTPGENLLLFPLLGWWELEDLPRRKRRQRQRKREEDEGYPLLQLLAQQQAKPTVIGEAKRPSPPPAIGEKVDPSQPPVSEAAEPQPSPWPTGSSEVLPEQQQQDELEPVPAPIPTLPIAEATEEKDPSPHLANRQQLAEQQHVLDPAQTPAPTPAIGKAVAVTETEADPIPPNANVLPMLKPGDWVECLDVLQRITWGLKMQVLEVDAVGMRAHIKAPRWLVSHWFPISVLRKTAAPPQKRQGSP